MPIKVSVILCTFNRAAMLREVLVRLDSQLTLSGLSAELVVVDNNSTDETPELCAAYKAQSRVPVKTVRETRQGSNHARNAGIQAAEGEILVFTDDDVEFSASWLVDLVEYMDEHPECDVVTGKITPKFAISRPNWLSDDVLPFYGDQDLGNEPTDIIYPKFPVEMNMAIRARIFQVYGDFNTDLNRDDKTLLSNDGKLFFYHLSKGGAVVRYIPNAHVFHLIPDNRTNVKWVLRRSFWQGVSDVAFEDLINQKSRNLRVWKNILDLLKLMGDVRGNHISPRIIYWRWHGLPISTKVWHAYKWGVMARKIGWK
ncbi:MAG: glycosyltransferase family 2 protein [Peptococcaceae bacterium]|nr:glycosyltransferase family 2 protein [Peptococcaceae bacterium]